MNPIIWGLIVNPENAKSFLWTCKASRKAVLVNLVRLIELEKWARLTFPMSECGYEALENMILSANIELPYFVTECLVTGGTVSRIAFQKDWEPADLDVFLGGDKNERHKEGQYDFIFKPKYPIVMNNFDLSVCQVGIEYPAKRVLCTPLFLWSYTNGIMLIMVRDISSTYEGLEEFAPGVLELKTLFGVHTETHNTADFVNCGECVYRIGREGGDKPITRWFERVRKYQARFPEMTFRYFE